MNTTPATSLEEMEKKAYPPMPKAGYFFHTGGGWMAPTDDGYTAEQMLAFADATVALRAAGGSATAGGVLSDFQVSGFRVDVPWWESFDSDREDELKDALLAIEGANEVMLYGGGWVFFDSGLEEAPAKSRAVAEVCQQFGFDAALSLEAAPLQEVGASAKDCPGCGRQEGAPCEGCFFFDKGQVEGAEPTVALPNALREAALSVYELTLYNGETMQPYIDINGSDLWCNAEDFPSDRRQGIKFMVDAANFVRKLARDERTGAASGAAAPMGDGEMLLDWLEKNIFHREMGDWDRKQRPGQTMWVMFAPSGVQGSARRIIRAAMKTEADHG